jgi:hypothetical protein
LDDNDNFYGQKPNPWYQNEQPGLDPTAPHSQILTPLDVFQVPLPLNESLKRHKRKLASHEVAPVSLQPFPEGDATNNLQFMDALLHSQMPIRGAAPMGSSYPQLQSSPMSAHVSNVFANSALQLGSSSFVDTNLFPSRRYSFYSSIDFLVSSYFEYKKEKENSCKPPFRPILN